ncbi:MAG: hypothetical protein WCW01_02070 [Gammaproteobacteria bacterium]
MQEFFYSFYSISLAKNRHNFSLSKLSYIYSTLSYIIEAGSIHQPEEFKEIIKNGLSDVDEEKIMTISEYYKQKGLESGIQQGLQTGQEKALQTVATKLLKEGEHINRITRLTGLPKDTIKAIQRNNAKTL